MNAQPISPEGIKMFKVAFDLEQERPDWPPVSVERLWGEKTAVKFQIKLINVPFFARGVSYGDLIQVRPDHDRRELVFEKFTAESGHFTVRIVIMKFDAMEDVQSSVRRLGCSWEKADQFASLLAVDIPPSVNYRPVRAWLSACARAEKVEFQESSISSTHRAQISDTPT